MTRTQSGFRLKTRPITVLFADDHEKTRSAYREAAGELGFAADTASTARDALAKAFLLRPDVVVADVRLPDAGGFELARLLRKDPRTARIPVVATTSIVARELVDGALEAGCVALLTKPCSVELIARTVTRALSDRDTHAAG